MRGGKLNEAKLVEQVSQCKELTRAFRFFQIITTLNRFEAKQGRALFSDTCGKQRLSCPPKFKITGV
jgi:hypothetical protein